ncbi:MAG: hypothetical protein ABIY55_26985 [Kofleriaceae bacterium]
MLIANVLACRDAGASGVEMFNGRVGRGAVHVRDREAERSHSKQI